MPSNSPDRQRHTEQAAEERQHETLHQHLADDAAAAGADGDAQRDFLGAARAAHEKQIRHVGAGDQAGRNITAPKSTRMAGRMSLTNTSRIGRSATPNWSLASG